MSFNAAGGVGGAAAGAQLGSMVLPGIGTAVGAVVGFVAGGLMGGGSDGQSASAIRSQAEHHRREMARSQAEIRRQRTMDILNTANAIQHIQRNSGQIKADISLQNATADAIGASAAASQIDAQKQEDRAKGESIRSLEYSVANQGQSLESQLGQSRSSTMAMLEASKQNRTNKADTVNSLISLGASFGSAWAGGAFGGSKSTPKTTSSTKANFGSGYGLNSQSVSGLRYGGR